MPRLAPDPEPPPPRARAPRLRPPLQRTSAPRRAPAPTTRRRDPTPLERTITAPPLRAETCWADLSTNTKQLHEFANPTRGRRPFPPGRRWTALARGRTSFPPSRHNPTDGACSN
jgi:hypothetical protein